MVEAKRNVLLEGDPLNPSSTDLIAQFADLDVGQRVPHGWRVLSGNVRTSMISRIVYRFEVE